MTNIEYIYTFANKHKFPQTECEVVFNTIDDGSGNDIYTTDYDIVSVKFDKSLVENEINIEDIRFDIDSNFPDDVFDLWQQDNPQISFRDWIATGRYIPTVVANAEFLYELETLTKEIEMKLESMFSNMEDDDGSSDFDDEDYDDEDFDLEDDEDEEDEDYGD
jgi:hypothetical protein